MSLSRSSWIATVAISLVILAAPLVHATIYTFVDEKGTVHFTNVPNDSRYRPLFRYEAKQKLPTYEIYISRAAALYEVDPLLIKAVIQAESGFDRRAVSRRGAKGLMQLMPETVADMNVKDPFDAEDNIHGGTRYLRWLLNTFEGDLQLSLAAYNAGPQCVRKLGRIPRIPETERYVKKVLATYQDLQNNPSLALF